MVILSDIMKYRLCWAKRVNNKVTCLISQISDSNGNLAITDMKFASK